MKADFAANPIIKKADLKISISIAKILLLLKRVPYIYHLVQFKKDQAEVQVLLDFNSEVYAITPGYVAKLGFKV